MRHGGHDDLRCAVLFGAGRALPRGGRRVRLPPGRVWRTRSLPLRVDERGRHGPGARRGTGRGRGLLRADLDAAGAGSGSAVAGRHPPGPGGREPPRHPGERRPHDRGQPAQDRRAPWPGGLGDRGGRGQPCQPAPPGRETGRLRSALSRRRGRRGERVLQLRGLVGGREAGGRDPEPGKEPAARLHRRRAARRRGLPGDQLRVPLRAAPGGDRLEHRLRQPVRRGAVRPRGRSGAVGLRPDFRPEAGESENPPAILPSLLEVPEHVDDEVCAVGREDGEVVGVGRKRHDGTIGQIA